jgi:carboxypeptidase C (cathepsin A)
MIIRFRIGGRNQRVSFYMFIFLLQVLCMIQCVTSRRLTPEDYRVKGLELIEPAFQSFHGDMYAGLIPTTLLSDLYDVNDEDSSNDDNARSIIEKSPGKLMFWLYVPNDSTYTDTIVTWMNGGPGCSSLAGCLFEHCPVTVPLHEAGFFGTENDPIILEPNSYAWTNATKMLYIEQPHNTGFGSGPDPTNETQVGHDVYIFLQNFYTIFDNTPIEVNNITDDNATNEDDTSLLHQSFIGQKLFMFGESYAGMYVPSVAYYIHEQNVRIQNDASSKEHHINLAGIGVGNGWIDPMIQGPASIDFLFWHGMIDKYTAQELHRSWENCMSGATMTKYPFHEFTTPDECGLGGAALLQVGDGLLDWGTPNVYDLSTFDK